MSASIGANPTHNLAQTALVERADADVEDAERLADAIAATLDHAVEDNPEDMTYAQLVCFWQNRSV